MATMGLAGGFTKALKQTRPLTAHIIDSQHNQRPYSLVDLGTDTIQLQTDDMPSGRLKLGRAWAEADFRISFAKFKTHIYDGYTLLVKNTYGCLPEGNKMWHYHKKTGAAKPTIVQLKHYPVHFGIIDAITGVDGMAGVKWDRVIPRKPGFILAGRNIGEVEKAACNIMGVKFKRSYMSRGAIELCEEESHLDGSIRPLGPWINVPYIIIATMPILERLYLVHRMAQMISDFQGDENFHRKPMPDSTYFSLYRIVRVLEGIKKREDLREELLKNIQLRLTHKAIAHLSEWLDLG